MSMSGSYKYGPPAASTAQHMHSIQHAADKQMEFFQVFKAAKSKFM